MELPLAITFNRERMMLLLASISKSCGLRELLNILGVSVHNAVGIGDAENDHELLGSCEYGAAVEWGSPLLKAQADTVISEQGPEAFGKYIEEISSQLRLPYGMSDHRKLVIESTEGQPPFEIAIRGRNLLIAGVRRVASLGSQGCIDSTRSDWYEPLTNLAITEAALLPPTIEAEEEFHRFCVALRLT